MPLRKSHHKKKSGYWVKKWLNKALIGLKLKKRRFQKPSPDIVFLTTKEVKESLAKTTEHEPINTSSDSASRPDPGILPQKNRSRRKSRNDKSFSFRLKRLLNRISFGSLKKKQSSSVHRQRSQSSLTDPAISAEARFQQLNKLNKINEDSTSEYPSINENQRHHHHRKRIHSSLFRKWKSIVKQKLHLSRGKNGFTQPALFENTESTTTDQLKKVPWTDYIKPTLTSTAMFMVAYQLSWFFYQLAVMVTASFFSFDSVLFYYEVMFPEASDSLKWSPEKIIIITLAGPLMALVAWISLSFILRLKDRYGAHFRMFLVWMYLMSMT